MKTAELTLLLGPPTRLSRALNDIVREERDVRTEQLEDSLRDGRSS